MAKTEITFPQPLGQYQVDVIRRKDFYRLVSLQAAAYQGYVGWSRSDFIRDVTRNPYAYYLVLRDKNRIIGLASGRIRFQESHLSHLLIIPAYQGQGLGQALLAKWLLACQTFGTKLVRLELRASNQNALIFYEKMGFQVVGQEKDYYPNNLETAILMEKR